MVLCLANMFLQSNIRKKVVVLHDLKPICGLKQYAKRGMSCGLKNHNKMAKNAKPLSIQTSFFSKKNSLKN